MPIVPDAAREFELIAGSASNSAYGIANGLLGCTFLLIDPPRRRGEGHDTERENGGKHAGC